MNASETIDETAEVQIEESNPVGCETRRDVWEASGDLGLGPRRSGNEQTNAAPSDSS
ncbi:hypothetical protein [Halorubrum halophilum]|uniref:hypothetical protein n=1 Tax=Halorubrum halophilum TaxID=413816 RepID=UPI000B0A7762|nr:hypothetical protein [Halorubrum halophilum]